MLVYDIFLFYLLGPFTNILNSGKFKQNTVIIILKNKIERKTIDLRNIYEKYHSCTSRLGNMAQVLLADTSHGNGAGFDEVLEQNEDKTEYNRMFIRNNTRRSEKNVKTNEKVKTQEDVSKTI